MADLWQFAKADGDPDWTPGSTGYPHTWNRAYDLLRFHRGEGFRIIDRKANNIGPVRPLSEQREPLRKHQLASPGSVFELQAVKDKYAILFRRVELAPDKGDLWLAEGKTFLGEPYVFGGLDCSGLTQQIAANFDIYLPHNAAMQHNLFKNSQGMRLISRAQVQVGDLLFHWYDDHVSTYAGKAFKDKGYDGECVLDTEPHDTGGPRGWPTQNLGTGVRFRPMADGWYCDWSHVNGIGRIVSVNGAP